MMDLRGTGRSQGCLDHLGPQGRAATSSRSSSGPPRSAWSNGRVGMTGHSYVGSTPSVAAAQNPKGLTTIVPSAGLASMYDHQFQGGVPFYLQWAGPQWSYEYLAVARKLPPIGQRARVTGRRTPATTSATTWRRPAAARPTRRSSPARTSLSGQLQRLAPGAATGARAPPTPTSRSSPSTASTTTPRASRRSTGSSQRRDARDKLWLGQWDHGSGCLPEPPRPAVDGRAARVVRQAARRAQGQHRARRSSSFLADTPSFSAARGGARTEVLEQSTAAADRRRADVLPDRRRRRWRPAARPSSRAAHVHRHAGGLQRVPRRRPDVEDRHELRDAGRSTRDIVLDGVPKLHAAPRR